MNDNSRHFSKVLLKKEVASSIRVFLDMIRLLGMQPNPDNRSLKIPLKLDLLFPRREGKRTGHPCREALLEVLRQILEAGELRKEGELHVAHGAAPVLPDDDLGDPLRLLRRLLLGVHLLAVDEQYQV